MLTNIKPPLIWNIENEFNNSNEIDVYKKIMNQFLDKDILFKVVKKNGFIKNLNKLDCKFLSNALANQIYNLTSGIVSRQLKIFAVIGASEESVILMLSSLLLGAHHSICFEDLSEDAILERIKIFDPDIIISKKNIEKKVESLSNRYKRIPKLYIDLNAIDKNTYLKFNLNNSNYNPNVNLFTLFTSGSTGKPKAVIHSVEKYLNYAEFTTNYFFGIKRFSTIFTATDAGWINGHTYAFYGPLLLGATSVINENPIFISLIKNLGKILEDTKPDCFYTSVTVLRFLKNSVNSQDTILNFVNEDINLDRVGSCGEPLAHSLGEWIIKFFKTKRKTIVNTYFQTETGGILVAPRDEDSLPFDYSSVGKPRQELGLVIASDVMDQNQIERENLEPNEILIKNPWDGLFKEIISDKKSNYFTNEGYFRLHDVGYFDENGFLFIGGRSDDVINVAGHRISTSEIESIAMNLESIREVCAVSIPDEFYGSRVVLYFAINSSKKISLGKLSSSIKNLIKNNLSQYHVPKIIQNFNNLPKTKSGKIMRRIMRDVAIYGRIDDSIDYSTLVNKEEFLGSLNQLLN